MGVGDREPSATPGRQRASARRDGASGIEVDAIADLGVDFAFRLDTGGTVTAVSGDIEWLLGATAEEVIDDKFEQYIAAGSLETAYDALDAVLSGETVRGMALRIAGDERPWIEVNAEPVRNAEGEVVAVRGAAREATERRRAIERHSEAMKGAMDGMALLDDDGCYLFVNDAHADLYGYDREELLGNHWSQLYDPAEQRRLEREALPEMVETGGWRGPAVGRRADGSTFQQELSLSDLEDGFVCVVRDVTERTRREQIIDVLDRVLRHNLRNEMNVVLGEAGDIARNAEGEQAAAAERIRDRARSLLAVSDTARTVREVVSGDHETDHLDLRSAVRQATDQVEAGGHDIATSLPERPLHVASPGCRHAVRELIENAVEHGSTSGPSEAGSDGPDGTAPAVSVDLFSSEDPGGAPVAVLRVADSGPGIPRMERRTLEEGSETPLRHGQGLGLWLVNWVTTEAGGDLSVDESDDGGTVVEMRLPLADSADG
jgi:PAS domain S-box-containing protein